MFSIEAMLRSSAERMRADLAERLVSHPGELGIGREGVIRQFLRAYLPGRFEVSSGFAFDAGGAVSEQLDIVIANSLVCPRFVVTGGTRFYPCESIVAVGQIKSSLTSRKEFRQAVVNIASAKALDRSATGSARDIHTGEKLDPLQNHLDQIFGFVMVVGRALSQDALRDELIDYVVESEPHLWPNVFFAMDKYLATFSCDDGVCPNPMHARGVAIQPVSAEDDLLLKFYLLLGRALDSVRVASLSYWEHLANVTGWSADVWYSATSDPPPFLSEIPR